MAYECLKDCREKPCRSAVRTKKCRGMVHNGGNGACISGASKGIDFGMEIPNAPTQRKKRRNRHGKIFHPTTL